MDTPIITNIQRYSIHDGNGIRTTVFFKGCPLECQWCHNPETQSYHKELLYDKERCIYCESCIKVCQRDAIVVDEKGLHTDLSLCNLCGECMEVCLQKSREFSGKEYSVDELIHELEKDRMFYEESGGGITLSGGEVLTQSLDYIIELLRKLKKKEYDIAIDTCGYAPFDNIKAVIPYVSTFLYDIKIWNDKAHKQYTGKSNSLILNNLIELNEFIQSNDYNRKISLRMPFITGINDDDASIDAISQFLKRNDIKVSGIHLLPYHKVGKYKYEKLQRVYLGDEFEPPSKERMEHIIEIFHNYGFENVLIGG